MKNEKHLWEQSVCAKYLPERCKALSQACKLIDEYLVDSIHPQILHDACEHGASSDDLEFILKRTAPDWKSVANAAARGGYIHVFEWMLERKDGRWPWRSDFKDVLTVAAAHGHLEVIKWLHVGRKGIVNVDDTVFDRAASEGRLTLAQWLYNRCALTGENYTLSCAAEKGHKEVVQWLYENLSGGGSRVEDGSYLHPTLRRKTASAMVSAAKGGHLELLEWLHQKVGCGDVCSTHIMDAAVKSGHFDVVQWLFANCNAGCSKYAAKDAAFRGDLPMLQWIYQHFGKICHLDVMDHAAMGGHLDVLKWLHKHRNEGCSTLAMNMAAANGHLEIVQWLHENRNEGCTTFAMKSAVDEGHLHVVEWLHENRSEGCGDSHMDWPVVNGDLKMVKWLVEHKPETCHYELMKWAVWEGHLDMVRYLDKNTCQKWSKVLRAAAQEGPVTLLLILLRLEFKFCVLDHKDRSRVDKFCRRLFSQTLNEGDTSASPVVYEILEMLELLHNDGFYECVSLILNRALYCGYLAMVRQFFERRSEEEKNKYVVVAKNMIVLLRWLLENGTSLSVDRYLSTIYSKFVEAAWWLPECDRVVVVRHALDNDDGKALLWMLENTVFEEDSSQHAIRCALTMDDNAEVADWVSENLSNESARSWCFPSKKEELGDDGERDLKRGRWE